MKTKFSLYFSTFNYILTPLKTLNTLSILLIMPIKRNFLRKLIVDQLIKSDDFLLN